MYSETGKYLRLKRKKNSFTPCSRPTTAVDTMLSPPLEWFLAASKTSTARQHCVLWQIRGCSYKIECGKLSFDPSNAVNYDLMRSTEKSYFQKSLAD